MGDMLSQEEIDALLGGGDSGNLEDNDNLEDAEALHSSDQDVLTTEQMDVLGEISNISMGTAATTLYTLLNHKVWITTPKVFTLTWDEFTKMHDRPSVGIRVGYKEGIIGSNVLILTVKDVKIITNLMMGGDGMTDLEGELTEIDLSAIGEAMNQMIGSSATSLSSMTNMKVDIETPKAFQIVFDNDEVFNELGAEFDRDDVLVCISFKMEIGNLIDSNIMQLLPLNFALEMVDAIRSEMEYQAPDEVIIPPKPIETYEEPKPVPVSQPPVEQNIPEPVQQQGYQNDPYQMPYSQPQMQYQQPQMPYPQPQMQYTQPPMQYNQMHTPNYSQPQNINVKPAQFQNFDYNDVIQQKENINIIKDVPLEVTVELGRTRKKIKEILEFVPGTIVELDKLAGEAIDIFVNGKFVAKGEVVVIDENFGIRITDIVSTEDRI